MISVDKAIEIILSSVSTVKGNELVNLFDATGRILFEDIKSPFNVPVRNNSAMDGYALIVSDTENAGPDKPSILKITGEIQAGKTGYGEIVKSGHAIRIMTGAPIPDGADAVIQFEDTEEADGVVIIKRSLEKWENIRFAGEDIKKGETILRKGCRLEQADIGLLASMNFTEASVYRKPEVAIVSTGDEILEPGNDNPHGRTYNSNSYALYSAVKQYGGIPHYMGIVPDDKEVILSKFREIKNFDIFISSGGVSMGKYDFIPDVLRELDIEIKIQKILMKPGKPVVFGTKDEKLFFGLPGNPVSVMIAFGKFVRPALLKMGGASDLEKPVITAIADEELKKKKGRRHFLRGIFFVKDQKIYVKSTGPQGSGILTSLKDANCLIILPEETEIIKKGEPVEIELIRHGEL